MKSKCFIIALGLMFVLFSTSLAQVPPLMNYQGKLTKTSGALLDTTIQMVFSIYADSAGTNLLWTETQGAVAVDKGVFNTLLGSVSPIPDTVFDGTVRYLGVKIGADPEITPRKSIVSVAYAFKSVEADTAEYAKAAPPTPDNDWVINGDTIYHLNGNVGIGTVSPQAKLDVAGNIRTTGNVVVPNAVWFIDYDSRGWVAGLGWNTVIYDRVGAGNAGGWYNTANGRFTAPVTGLYWFHSMHFISSFNSGANYIHHTIGVNGSVASGGGQSPSGVFTIFDLNQSSDEDGSTEVTRILFLNAGDYVNVNVYISGGPGSNYMYGMNSYFAGYLIYRLE